VLFRSLWRQRYADLAKDRFGIVGSATARGEAQVMRIALIFALLDQSPVIGAAHLEAGYAIWDYCEQSAGRIFGDRTGNPLADIILAELRRRPAGLTRTQISCDLLQRNKPSFEIDEALKLLERQNHARRSEIGSDGKGRPTTRWFAVLPS